MAFEAKLVVLFTLDSEHLNAYLKKIKTSILHLGTNIWSVATNKGEFVQAGLDRLDSFKKKAEAEIPPLQALNLANCQRRSEIQKLIANVARVDRNEFVRLLSLAWDKKHGNKTAI
jgi:hypothetical protein